MSTDARRNRVERGLMAALQIAGHEPATYTIAERMKRYLVPGVAVAVVDDGEVSWSSGYGCAVRGGAAVHATTLFQAASISKAVAAVGVLALVEHGELDLDADVNSQLRSWRLPATEHTSMQPVTLRHLLSHTGGTTVPGFPGYAAGAAVPSVLEVLSGSGAANTPAVESFARPGSVSQYSGGGTTVVQQLVCDVTGRPFPDVIHDLVLRPMGMVDSAYEQPPTEARSTRAASGHDESGGPLPGGYHVYPELQAAGLWTTVVDLARWVLGVQQILGGRREGPISPEMAMVMVTPLPGGVFGLGPEIGGQGTFRRFGHSGSNAGFRGQVDGLVERPVGGVVLTNADGGNSLMGEIRLALAAEYDWGPIAPPPIHLAEVHPAMLASYAGRYVGPFDRPMKLVFADGELFSPAPYGRRRMLPLGPTTFLDEETGATLEVHCTGERVARIAVLVGDAELMSFDPVPSDEGAE